MAEKLIVHVDRDRNVEFAATDPTLDDSQDFRPVMHIIELNPYSALLASWGWCTALVLYYYASHHGVPLDDVVIRLHFGRSLPDHCPNCESLDNYEEPLEAQIELGGTLSEEQRSKLMLVAHQCPIHRMLKYGSRLPGQAVRPV
jgi:uncharacterized OsmC-like protein